LKVSDFKSTRCRIAGCEQFPCIHISCTGRAGCAHGRKPNLRDHFRGGLNISPKQYL